MTKAPHLPYPRFRSIEDADQAMAFLRDRRPIPNHLLIWPFIQKDREIVPNPDYAKARYEIQPKW